MMTTPTTLQRYYNPVRRLLSFRPPLLSQSKAFTRYQDQRGLDSNERYNPALSTRVPYRRQNFNSQRSSPFNRSAPPSLQQSTSNPSAPRDYNRADQPSCLSDQPSVVRRDPLTNHTHPQRDPAINRIHPQGSGTGHSSAPCQPYQSYLPQRAYQTVAEEFKYKGTDNHPLEDLPDMGHAEEEPNDEDIFYTTEEPDKLFVNFLGVETVCHRCKSIFSSKSLIHKHLKSNCVG